MKTVDRTFILVFTALVVAGVTAGFFQPDATPLFVGHALNGNRLAGQDLRDTSGDQDVLAVKADSQGVKPAANHDQSEIRQGFDRDTLRTLLIIKNLTIIGMIILIVQLPRLRSFLARRTKARPGSASHP